MGHRKKDLSKVVVKQVNGTYLDVRMVFKRGNKNGESTTEYAIYHTKNRVDPTAFKKPELAIEYIGENFSKYNKKEKKFM